MTRAMILELAQELSEEDVIVTERTNNLIDFTFIDFVGFDDNYEEIFREYANENAINTFLLTLQNSCIDIVNTIGIFTYTTYVFENFSVRVSYTSADI